MTDLPLEDLIRMNRLVRRGIDLLGLLAWYGEVEPDRQRLLAHALFGFAAQAGYIAEDLAAAIDAIGLDRADPLAARLTEDWADPAAGSPTYRDRHARLESLDDRDRRAAFAIGAWLFGLAEGRVYRAERKEWCNHWWHRDLLDERVVRALLADPTYYRTSMKDDDDL